VTGKGRIFGIGSEAAGGEGTETNRSGGVNRRLREGTGVVRRVGGKGGKEREGREEGRGRGGGRGEGAKQQTPDEKPLLIRWNM